MISCIEELSKIRIVDECIWDWIRGEIIVLWRAFITLETFVSSSIKLYIDQSSSSSLWFSARCSS